MSLSAQALLDLLDPSEECLALAAAGLRHQACEEFAGIAQLLDVDPQLVAPLSVERVEALGLAPHPLPAPVEPVDGERQDRPSGRLAFAPFAGFGPGDDIEDQARQAGPDQSYRHTAIGDVALLAQSPAVIAAAAG